MSDPSRIGPNSDGVSQATGMVSVQAECTIAQAFDLLRERAFSLGKTLEDTALGVIGGEIRFNGKAPS